MRKMTSIPTVSHLKDCQKIYNFKLYEWDFLLSLFLHSTVSEDRILQFISFWQSLKAFLGCNIHSYSIIIISRCSNVTREVE